MSWSVEQIRCPCAKTEKEGSARYKFNYMFNIEGQSFRVNDQFDIHVYSNLHYRSTVTRGLVCDF